MATRTWLGCATAAVVSLGCGSQPTLSVQGCNPGGNCFVAISVAANCEITVVPDTLDVPLPRGAKKITWELVTSGYVFAANGIAFKQATSEFDEPELGGSGSKFHWRDKHTVSGQYAYAVNLIRTGPNPGTCVKDPLISNR